MRTELLFSLVLGLLMGLALQRMGLARPHRLQSMLTLRRSPRSLLTALGGAMTATALLSWLAVLDVDLLHAVPLSGSLLAGALLIALALGLTGLTPGLILAQLGGGAPLPALCALLGGVAGALVWTLLPDPAPALDRLFSPLEGTLTRTTLAYPYALPGGFLLQGAIGLVIWGVGLCLGHERSPAPALQPQQPLRTAEDAAEAPPTPEDTAAETVVATLPQEEPITLDTVPVVLPGEVTEALTEPVPEETEAASDPDDPAEN